MSKSYSSGAASLFASLAREQQVPLYEGQRCCYCLGDKGQLDYLAYDPDKGELWIHPACRRKLRSDMDKLDRQLTARGVRMSRP